MRSAPVLATARQTDIERIRRAVDRDRRRAPSLVGRLLNDLLFGIEPFDPVTFVGAPVVLGATALLAAYLPARRASRIDLVVALHNE